MKVVTFEATVVVTLVCQADIVNYILFTVISYRDPNFDNKQAGSLHNLMAPEKTSRGSAATSARSNYF